MSYDDVLKIASCIMLVLEASLDDKHQDLVPIIARLLGWAEKMS